MAVNTDSTTSSSTRGNPLDTLAVVQAALIQLENEVGNSASSFSHSGRDKVSIVDGSFVSISSKGDNKLSNVIFLSSVLHVPMLSTNLLSCKPIPISSKDSDPGTTVAPVLSVEPDPGTKDTIDERHPIMEPSPSLDDLDLPIAVRKGKHRCTTSTAHNISQFLSYDHLSPFYKSFLASIADVPIPITIQEALELPEWKDAIKAELDALIRNNTWEIVDQPKVAKMTTVRVLLSLATSYSWSLYQIDVKNAFLNRDLQEEVYMQLPPRFYGIETGKKDEESSGHLLLKLDWLWLGFP
ncbi:PREDICTED: uncharacterized protein LOC104604817 [Nelumbo nucifera]|uniref:Uncharacterized protein LOC104604817 n=1 Tax=Nelumbo nucifera TaxID=4432 RepID=A0A1U8ANE9_NELNU|nr:PREDICTED: uncharacterized protein LOC104604817 [Nelumbo nucifera]